MLKTKIFLLFFAPMELLKDVLNVLSVRVLVNCSQHFSKVEIKREIRKIVFDLNSISEKIIRCSQLI